MSPIAQLGVTVTRLVTDSRAIVAGDTFVAYVGEKQDGRTFITQAIARGANAVLWEAQGFVWNPAWQVPNVGIANLRQQAGELADAVYGQPSEKLWVVGVTGTNGKTSTSHWISEVLTQNTRKCALIGTLGNGFQGALQPSVNTTPDAIRVHLALADYWQQGAQAVAMEVSSHALSQDRVNAVRFDVALLTNLSRDHLDYHGSMEDYAASKQKLFEQHDLKYAVLNFDDVYGRELSAAIDFGQTEVIGYGLSEDARDWGKQRGFPVVQGELRAMDRAGLQLAIQCDWGDGLISSGLIGRFNAENLLAVLAVSLVSGVPFDAAMQSLATVQPVAGRMQCLTLPNKPNVLVDYAHTPDALEKVLLTLRESSGTGKLYCVFGCGGDRDRGKRALMGKVAEQYADGGIVTSDNPRSEMPAQIIAEVLSGMGKNTFEVVVDRALAIQRMIQHATPNDTVLIAGKGHENYQEIQGIRYPFSDVDVALEALNNV